MIQGNERPATTYVGRESCKRNANASFFTSLQVYGLGDVPLPDNLASWITVTVSSGSFSKSFSNMGDSSVKNRLGYLKIVLSN